MKRLLVCGLVPLMLLACEREVPPADTPAAAGAPAAAVQPVPEGTPRLEDTVEMERNYILGISYPPEANRYPGLATELHAYAEAARRELMDAVAGADLPGDTMYDLSLGFTTLADTPDLLAIAADGSTYTGGAHDSPLIRRFVWLVAEERLLTAEDLLEDDDGWREISGFVREHLHSALSQRIDADELPADERGALLRSAGRMIDEGSGPDVANYRQFEPILGEGGKLSGLRFVFPPYQVGPYSDGVQTVEVPASVLLPLLAPRYRGLFVSGRPQAVNAPAQ